MMLTLALRSPAGSNLAPMKMQNAGIKRGGIAVPAMQIQKKSYVFPTNT